jgi:hypothetical protein
MLVFPALAVVAGAWFVLANRTSPVVPPNHPAVVGKICCPGGILPDHESGVFFVSQDPQDTIREWDAVENYSTRELAVADLPEGHTFLIVGAGHSSGGIDSSISRIDEDDNGVITMHHTMGDIGGFGELVVMKVYFLVALPDAPVDVDQYRVESYFVE